MGNALAKIKAGQDYIDAENRIADQQKIVDDYNTALKNVTAVKAGQGHIDDLKNKLNEAQSSLSALQDIYNHDKAILDNMVVEGSTGDQTNNGDATKPGEDTKANQGNSNATATAGQKSNVSVKANGKKVVAATKAKAKKLPQTGNDSAAVVALGVLTGMLGLGLAAKKRAF